MKPVLKKKIKKIFIVLVFVPRINVFQDNERFHMEMHVVKERAENTPEQ